MVRHLPTKPDRGRVRGCYPYPEVRVVRWGFVLPQVNARCDQANITIGYRIITKQLPQVPPAARRPLPQHRAGLSLPDATPPWRSRQTRSRPACRLSRSSKPLAVEHVAGGGGGTTMHDCRICRDAAAAATPRQGDGKRIFKCVFCESPRSLRRGHGGPRCEKGMCWRGKSLRAHVIGCFRRGAGAAHHPR